MLFKFNVYPRFAISRQLSNLLELSSLTLYLLGSSADNLWINNLDQDHAGRE